MPAADPTYPLYPIACILSSALLLLVLATSFARQSWNLGVAFLCFWLFWMNLANGVSTVLWSDNYDIKLYVYCDIVSHLQVIVNTVKPMCTLIIVRRLYLISTLRSVELSSSREKHKNMIIEWTLGLIVPLVVAGPLFYVVQATRFVVREGPGCADGFDSSILGYLLIQSWTIVPPLISLVVYYPKVIWVFYRQRRDTNRFLRSNSSISRTNYFRILALASVDLLFTLPIGVVNLVINFIEDSVYYYGSIPFYSGWDVVHSDWAPAALPYAQLTSQGFAAFVQVYFPIWTSAVLAFIIFGLFGLTAEARATYWRAICFVGRWFGWKPKPRTTPERPTLGTMEFGESPQEISLDAELGSRPSFVDSDLALASHAARAKDTEKGEREVDATVVDNVSFGSADEVGHHNESTAAVTPSREKNQA